MLGAVLTLGVLLAGYATYSAYTQLPTATSGAPLTSTMWNNTITTVNQHSTDLTTVEGQIVPSGAVIAFNLSSCPTGWSVANGTNGTADLRGDFIRGLDSGRGVDSGRSLATEQLDAFQGHSFTVQ